MGVAIHAKQHSSLGRDLFGIIGSGGFLPGRDQIPIEEAGGLRLVPRHEVAVAVALSEIRRSDVQDLVDRLLGRGENPSTIRRSLDPLRAIFRWAEAIPGPR